MILNHFEAYSWWANSKPITCKFRVWLKGRKKDTMYNVPECDNDEHFKAWVARRADPARTFYEREDK